MLSGSSSSGGVGVGVGFRRGGGGGSPNVGGPDGRVVCGVGVGVAVDAGRAGAVVAGVGVGLGAGAVVRGLSWLSAKTLDPKTRVETIKPQIAIIPVRLTFCSLNNGKLPLENARAGANRYSHCYAQVKRCSGGNSELPNAGSGAPAVCRSRTDVMPAPANCSCRLFFKPQRAPAVA
jgi:hypothetical protein